MCPSRGTDKSLEQAFLPDDTEHEQWIETITSSSGRIRFIIQPIAKVIEIGWAAAKD
jgi:hypothetical protein